ncbi:MAG: SMI1/KNR4 family protein [Paracoccaceae bacterium]
MDKNKCIDPNQYGVVTYSEISIFESKVGIQLPLSYKKYLAERNGGRPENAWFPVFNSPSNLFFEVDTMCSLNCGPEYQRLELQWSLPYHHDLKEFSEDLRNYFVFGYATEVVKLMIDLNSGAVYFYDPDQLYATHSSEVISCFGKVSDSFQDFWDNLLNLEKIPPSDEW